MKYFLTFILIALLLSCTSNSSTETTQVSATITEEIDYTQICEKNWDEFRFELIENSQDFDWAMYGIETADMFYDITEDLDSEYAKEILSQTTYEMLADGFFEGKKTKYLSIVAASADIIVGYNYHFTFSEYGVLALVGRSNYE